MTLDWNGVDINTKVNHQMVQLRNGMKLELTTNQVGTADFETFDKYDDGPVIVATTKPTLDDVIEAGKTMTYPDSYITLGITFEHDIDDLFISVGDIDTTSIVADATRIRMFDANDNEIPMQVASNNQYVKIIDNFAYSTKPNYDTTIPGFDFSLYAKAGAPVRKILLDQSVFIYDKKWVNQRSYRRG